MKKNKIIDEVDWILTEESRSDKNLNPIDLDILAVLQFIKDGKDSDKEGWFNIIIKDGDNIRTSLQGMLDGFGVKCDYTTVLRSINKLVRFGYIDYSKGWYNNRTETGRWPMIKILKGTIDLPSANYSDIAISKTDCFVNLDNDIKLSDCNTENYSVIAIAQEKEKENKKENYKENKKEILKEKEEEFKKYLVSKYTNCSWETFVKLHPEINSFELPMECMENCYIETK